MEVAADNDHNGAAIVGAMIDRFAAEDAAAREWLERAVKVGGRCRFCGAGIRDGTRFAVCASSRCRRKDRRERESILGAATVNGGR